jgi:hypothetical protein
VAASLVNGCVIERDYVYMAMRSDELDIGVDFSHLTYYDGSNLQKQWGAHDVPWYAIAVSVWTNGPLGPRVYVAMSQQGDVEITGPNRKPYIVEHIPGTGLTRSWSQGRGTMFRLRQIGSHIYACGSGFGVFRRDSRGWTDLTPKNIDFSDSIDGMIIDVNGANENQIYAVGIVGRNRSSIDYFNGSEWKLVDQNARGALVSICPSQNGGVYIGGSDGTFLYGDHISGFQPARFFTGEISIDSAVYTGEISIGSMAEFQDRVFLTTNVGLFVTFGPGHPLTPAVVDLTPPLEEVIWLEARDGVLWAFGTKDLAVFDGKSWTRIRCPYF